MLEVTRPWCPVCPLLLLPRAQGELTHLQYYATYLAALSLRGTNIYACAYFILMNFSIYVSRYLCIYISIFLLQLSSKRSGGMMSSISWGSTAPEKASAGSWVLILMLTTTTTATTTSTTTSTTTITITITTNSKFTTIIATTTTTTFNITTITITTTTTTSTTSKPPAVLLKWWDKTHLCYCHRGITNNNYHLIPYSVFFCFLINLIYYLFVHIRAIANQSPVLVVPPTSTTHIFNPVFFR